MDSWQAEDAEEEFGRLLDTACLSGPQVVMQGKHAAAVVMSMRDFQALKGQADRQFADFLLASPMDGADFDVGIGPRLSDEG